MALAIKERITKELEWHLHPTSLFCMCLRKHSPRHWKTNDYFISMFDCEEKACMIRVIFIDRLTDKCDNIEAILSSLGI